MYMYHVPPVVRNVPRLSAVVRICICMVSPSDVVTLIGWAVCVCPPIETITATGKKRVKALVQLSQNYKIILKILMGHSSYTLDTCMKNP